MERIVDVRLRQINHAKFSRMTFLVVAVAVSYCQCDLMLEQKVAQNFSERCKK